MEISGGKAEFEKEGMAKIEDLPRRSE